MPLNVCNHREKAAAAVRRFREIRELGPREEGAGPTDKPSLDPMCGFLDLMRELVEENGLPDARVSIQPSALPRSGPFCPAKLWSMVVFHRDRLIAALDLKSPVTPGGPNSDTLAADALGSSHDFWAAYREGAFGTDVPKPFLGWLILLDDEASAPRYEQLCKTLVREQRYTAASVVHSRPNNEKAGPLRRGSRTSAFNVVRCRLCGAHGGVFEE